MIGNDPHGDEEALFIKQLHHGQPEGNKEHFAHWEEANHRYLATKDVGAMHRYPGSPKPDITEREFAAVIETYARLHATFWGRTDRWSDFFQQNACRTVSHEATNPATLTA